MAAGFARLGGTCNSGMGLPVNNRRVSLANRLAHELDRLRRALSVEMPVLAYICRYKREIRTNATRPLSDLIQFDLPQTAFRL